MQKFTEWPPVLIRKWLLLTLIGLGCLVVGVVMLIAAHDLILLYTGLTKLDYLGREIPVSAHGTADLGGPTSSTKRGLKAVLKLFDKIVDKKSTARRLNIAAIRVARETDIPVQFDLFSDHAQEERERELGRAIIAMHRKYGKNAVLRGHDLLEGATQIERNGQIGGHRKG